MDLELNKTTPPWVAGDPFPPTNPVVCRWDSEDVELLAGIPSLWIWKKINF